MNRIFSRKLCAPQRRDGVERDAGQHFADTERLGRCGQRHKPRQGLGEPQAEAFGDVIGKAGRAHLRDREPAGREHERCGGEVALVGLDAEVVGARNVRDAVAEPHIDVSRRAFGEQHRDDGARGAVAEQLPERLLVIGDAMPLDQRDEVVLGVAVERRLVEMRIGRDEPLRFAIEIGEVAASASGDQDFRARPCRDVRAAAPWRRAARR